MHPLISFFGGKWRVAPRYPLPQYGTIIEPFAGSAGYSVRYPDRSIILIDKDERIIGTWQYLITASEHEIRRLPDIPIGYRVDDFDLTSPQQWLIGWWLNKGTVTPCKQPSTWARERPKSGWGPEIRERIASSLHMIRHWQAIHGDYTDAPDVEATWFIDPPYMGKPGSRYTYGNKDIDYVFLAKWVKARSGQVIACEHDGANWLPFEPYLIAKGGEGRKRTGISRESIYYREAA